MAGNLLELRNLVTGFATRQGRLVAVDGASLEVRPGRALGVAGESGSGKSIMALSILRLVPHPGRIEGGEIVFEGRDLLELSERQMCRIRGNRISMVFQEPMTSLNPVYTVGAQIAEVLRVHQGMKAHRARDHAVQMLARVGIAAPEERVAAYPHQLSGGMRQRVMIALALCCRPALLLADEPTTALDVTVQAQIMDLLADLRRELGMSVLLISHDLGLLAQYVDDVAVMYAGRIVETAPAGRLFTQPAHPYTQGLMRSMPAVAAAGRHRRRLPTIPGAVLRAGERIEGCRFRPRCELADDRCAEQEPSLDQVGPAHRAACFHPARSDSEDR